MIRYPEMTKNISTPMKPPGRNYGHAWNINTAMIATALRPSISFL